jgi:hypothetical protein
MHSLLLGGTGGILERLVRRLLSDPMPLLTGPDAADAAWGDQETLLAQFIGEADLSPARLVESDLGHGLFDLGG